MYKFDIFFSCAYNIILMHTKIFLFIITASVFMGGTNMCVCLWCRILLCNQCLLTFPICSAFHCVLSAVIMKGSAPHVNISSQFAN